MKITRDSLWRWPLWSWTHLAITLAAIALVLAGLGRLQAATGESATPAVVASPTESVSAATPLDAGPAPAQSTVPPGPGAGSPEPPPDAASAPPDVGDPVAAALTFTAAWARPYDPPRTWRARLTPLATTGFAALLETTDPARVPATRAQDHGRLLTHDGNTARVRIVTDNGAVLVGLVHDTTGWLVDAIEPDDSTGMPR